MKSWRGKLLLSVTAPLIFLGVLELCLRVMGAGYDTSFLIKGEVGGEKVWVENPFFTYQTFSPPMARIPPPIVVKKNKPANAFRVVVLGESAAQGDPVPDYGPPRVLEYLLRHQDPDADVQVINAAITAINSHQVRAIARELHKLQPDVVVVYMGNNEVIGPYGPGTVFAGYVDSDLVVRLSVWLNKFRLAQSIRFLLHLASEGKEAGTFGGVSMFMDNPVRRDDPRLHAVRRRFEQNLRAIIAAATQSGARVLLNTVAVNVTDCPPVISVHNPRLTHAEQAAWQRVYDRGISIVNVKGWERALAYFNQALEVDDQHAELNYWAAICLQELGRHDEAYDRFVRAVDLDAFRYRTDSSLNNAIRRIAGAFGDPVMLVDAAAAFRSQGPPGDDELFVDHVHFTFDGTAQLARLWADAMVGLEEWSPHATRPDHMDTAGLKEQLLYTQMAEITVLQEMHRRYRKPPFSLQLNASDRMERYARRIESLNHQLRSPGANNPAETFAARIAAYPDDLYFESHLVHHLIARNEFVAARNIAEQAVSRYPHRRGPRSSLAFLLAREGQVNEAVEVLFGYQRKHGYFAATSASYLFGLLLAGGQDSEAAQVGEAIDRHVRGLDYRWRIRDEWQKVALVSDRMAEARRALLNGNLTGAEQPLRIVHQMRPDLGEPLFLLGWVQALKGDRARGFQMVRQALGTMNFARAHYHGGLWQVAFGDVKTASFYFDQALEHAGDDLVVINSMAWIYAVDKRDELRNPAKARELLEAAIRRREPVPVPAFILDTLSAALASDNEFEQALEVSQRAAAQAAAGSHESLYLELLDHQDGYKRGAPAAWGRVNRPLNYFGRE